MVTILILSVLGIVDVYVFINPYVGEIVGYIIMMALLGCVLTILNAAEKKLRKDGSTGF